MGIDVKKMRLNGNSLKVNEINSSVNLDMVDIAAFLQEFESNKSYMNVRTSGSTGLPKTIRLSRNHMKASAAKTIEFLKLQDKDRSLMCLPSDKIGGIMMLVRGWVGNLDLHIVPAQSEPLKKVDGNFEFAAMVPYQVSKSLDQIHRIKKLIIGGGAIPPVLERELKKHKGEIWHTYGMTETISHVAMRRINGSDHTVFKALPEVSFTIDKRKCLVITAPHIGVESLETNDVVDLINTTTFKWLGRFDHVVNSGGVKLYPETIEQKTGEWERPFFLAGLPDDALGEKLIMVVEGGEPVHMDEVKFLFKELSAYETPKEIRVIKQFEYTANGKLNRAKTLLKI